MSLPVMETWMIATEASIFSVFCLIGLGLGVWFLVRLNSNSQVRAQPTTSETTRRALKLLSPASEYYSQIFLALQTRASRSNTLPYPQQQSNKAETQSANATPADNLKPVGHFYGDGADGSEAEEVKSSKKFIRHHRSLYAPAIAAVAIMVFGLSLLTSTVAQYLQNGYYTRSDSVVVEWGPWVALTFIVTFMVTAVCYIAAVFQKPGKAVPGVSLAFLMFATVALVGLGTISTGGTQWVGFGFGCGFLLLTIIIGGFVFSVDNLLSHFRFPSDRGGQYNEAAFKIITTCQSLFYFIIIYVILRLVFVIFSPAYIGYVTYNTYMIMQMAADFFGILSFTITLLLLANAIDRRVATYIELQHGTNTMQPMPPYMAYGDPQRPMYGYYTPQQQQQAAQMMLPPQQMYYAGNRGGYYYTPMMQMPQSNGFARASNARAGNDVPQNTKSAASRPKVYETPQSTNNNGPTLAQRRPAQQGANPTASVTPTLQTEIAQQ